MSRRNREKRKQQRAHKKTTESTLSPESFIQQGNIPQAIDILRSQLANEPTDERKRLLGQCFLELHDYEQATAIWSTIEHPTTYDLGFLGIIWLELEEWERAMEIFQRSLAIEENAYAYYCQAQAIAQNRSNGTLTQEERTTIIALLQKALSLPECPVEVFLWIDTLFDDVIPDSTEFDRRTHLKKALQFYPDNNDIRQRYLTCLMQHEQYTEVLEEASPLLSQPPPPQWVLALVTRAAFKLDQFERALFYANQLQGSYNSFHSSAHPSIEQIKGDIYLAWGKWDEAIGCYEQEIERQGLAAFLAYFHVAKAWLTRDSSHRALQAAVAGIQCWLDWPVDFEYYDVLADNSIPVGKPDERRNASLDPDNQLVKEVYETLLSTIPEMPTEARALLTFLHCVYMYIYADDEKSWAEIKTLLPTIMQGTLHPHMGSLLARAYLAPDTLARAVTLHLESCLWQYTTLETYRLIDAADSDQWAFDAFIAEIYYKDTLELKDCTQEELEQCHAIVWKILQSHLTTAAIVTDIFVPFFHSFWDDVLITGHMWQQRIATLQALLQVTPDDEELWWRLAYSLQTLEQFDEAEHAYRTHLRLKPNSASAMHNLSLIVEKKGTLQEAVDLAQQATTLIPTNKHYTENYHRLSKHLASQVLHQQLKRGTEYWVQLSDSQKWLLCLLMLYPSKHWSALLSHIKQEEKIRQLQTDWEWLLAHEICRQEEAEQVVSAIPEIVPHIQQEGFQYWLAAEIVRVQARKKKDLWLPEANELGDEQLRQLTSQQRSLLHQAFMRQIKQVSPSGLEHLYLGFYRRIWKNLLIEWKMYAELVDCCEIFLSRLSIMTEQERWECAYYASDLTPPHYLQLAEKLYLEIIDHEDHWGAFYNLTVLYYRRKAYEDALVTIEEAIRLDPTSETSLSLKEKIEQAIREETERKRQQALARQKAKEERASYLKGLEREITAHLGDVDIYKQRILQAIRDASSGYGSVNKRTLARDVRMEDWSFNGHWKKLVAWNMILEEGKQFSLHPLVTHYLDQGWPVPLAPSMRTVVIHPNNTNSWTKPVFNSKQEYALYRVLLEMLPSHLIFPNMALQTIFPYEKMKELLSKEEFSYYMVSSVDFCVTLTTTYLPLVALELDGPHHETEDQQKKDLMKNAIFEKGGLGLIRLQIGTQPLSPDEMWRHVRTKIQDALHAWRSDALHQGWVSTLESELGMDQQVPTDSPQTAS